MATILQSLITTAALSSGMNPDQLRQMQFNQQVAQGTQSGGVSADGYYTIWSVRHYGDTRGNPWYSEVITMAVDPAKLSPQVGGKV
jgi:hypothetical protein